MKYIVIIALSLIPFTKCAAWGTKKYCDGKDTIQQVTLDTLAVNAPAGVPVFCATSTKVWEIYNTRVALTFNREMKTASAREWINLHPYFYATDTIVLDAKNLQIDSVILVSRNRATPLRYNYADNQLTVYLGHFCQRSDSIALYLKYTAMPYTAATGGSGAITDDRGLYFINTDNKVPHKPSEIWTQGETESNSRWMITIDKPNTRFTTQIELTVPDSCVTLSNGAIIKQVKMPKGMRTDIWRMDMPIQAYVVMFAIGKFSITKDKWRNKEVNYYTEPEYAPYARLIFRHTPEMMEYFSKRTGVLFPWNKYDQVVVRDYVSGAMENTSAALFGEFMNQNAREIADKNFEDVVSHELFHEWFGDYVTCESWSNITVNESFANYGEQLWRSHKYGKASGDELAYNDLHGYIQNSQANDPQLVRFYYDSREDVFDAISYNKGGAILRYMNELMGDAAFDRAMNIYLTTNALHAAEAQNWRLAVEQATGQDWNRFFNEWYYRAGHPVLKVAYKYNDTIQKLAVTVTQAQSDTSSLYHLPLKTALIYGDALTVLDWNISRRADTFYYAYKNGQRPVIIPDYAHVLPGEVKDGKKPEQWLAQFHVAGDYISKRQALAAAGKLMSDSSSQVIINTALSDSLASIRGMALQQLENTDLDKYHKKWVAKVIAMATNDADNMVRAKAFDVLGEWKSADVQSLLIAAVYDSSYAVAGAALGSLGKINKDTAYLLARLLENTLPKSTLENAVWILIGKKGADNDIDLYEKFTPYINGSKILSFAITFSSYLKNVKSDVSFHKGAELYAIMIRNENLKPYRAALSGFLFQIATEQKSKAKADNKEDAAVAQIRMDILKPILQKITSEENDTEILKQDKKRMSDIFE